MEQLRLPIFTSEIKYYNLRIEPPEPVFGKVTELKKLFEFAYGKQPLSRSKPHITIASFRMNVKHQDALIQVFNKLSERKAFKLNINGFDVFEGSKTLYLNVTHTEALKTLHQQVWSLYSNHLKRNLKSFTISDTPHMTISTTKSKQMLYDSLQYFQKNQYSKQIEVNTLALVSKLKHRTWEWNHEIKLS